LERLGRSGGAHGAFKQTGDFQNPLQAFSHSARVDLIEDVSPAPLRCDYAGGCQKLAVARNHRTVLRQTFGDNAADRLAALTVPKQGPEYHVPPLGGGEEALARSTVWSSRKSRGGSTAPIRAGINFPSRLASVAFCERPPSIDLP
jgi:hypothetical protein